MFMPTYRMQKRNVQTQTRRKRFCGEILKQSLEWNFANGKGHDIEQQPHNLTSKQSHFLSSLYE